MQVVRPPDRPVCTDRPTLLMVGPPSARPWFAEALKLLSWDPTCPSNLTVFVPQTDAGDVVDASWGHEFLESATVVLFWHPDVPADYQVEWGYRLAKGALVYGHPRDVAGLEHMDWLARRNGIQVHSTLTTTVNAALQMLHEGRT